MKMKSMRYIGLLLVLLTGLTACQKPEAPTETKLVVMTWDEESFMRNYGELFMSKNPNYDIEVVSMESIYSDPVLTPLERYKELVKTHQPDVLHLLDHIYAEILEDNDVLYPLETFVNADFDIDKILPVVTNALRASDNQLYGLAPSFVNTVLFYNKSLFDQYSIAYPEEQMAWDELLMLASRFSGNPEGIYGYQAYSTSGNLAEFVIHLGLNQAKLAFYDTDTLQTTLNINAWFEIWNTSLNAYRNNGIYLGEKRESLYSSTKVTYKPFYEGKMAMAMGGLWMLEELKKSPFEWDFVSAPFSESGNLFLSEIYGMYKDSPQLEAAWKLVRFINSEEVEQLQVRRSSSRLSTRAELIREREGRDLTPFYTGTIYGRSDETPLSRAFYSRILEEGMPVAERVLKGEQTLEEALQLLNERGQEILDELVIMGDED